jgi:general L-amino acid transport system substrate-binding protein
MVRHLYHPRTTRATDSMRATPTALLALWLSLLATGADAGARLDAIKSKGVLTCGLGDNVAGFSEHDSGKNWRGFDVDLCRAVAAAILGDPAKAAFTPLDTLPRFMQSPEIDVVLRGLTWTFGREAQSSVRFGPIVLYDGQTFLVPKRLNVQTPEQLSGKLICVSTDVEFMTQLQAYFRARNLTLRTLATALRPEAEDAFFAGRCDAMAADASELAEAVIAKAQQPDDFTILPQQITKEPLAPFMRNDDAQFFDAVRWTIFALINAEELGINAANVEAMRTSDNIEIRRFFAPPPPGTSSVGRNWTYDVVKSVGNYGEIYDRHLGEKSRAKLARGLNRLWTQGGLMYAPPIR